jgi:hypothetical protein
MICASKQDSQGILIGKPFLSQYPFICNLLISLCLSGEILALAKLHPAVLLRKVLSPTVTFFNRLVLAAEMQFQNL